MSTELKRDVVENMLSLSLRHFLQIGRRLLNRLRGSLEYLPLIVMFTLYVVIYTAFLLIRYDSFQSDYYDLGLWSRAIFSASNDLSRFLGLILPSGDSMIGHTDPFLALFVPFARIWPDPRWLLVATTLGLGASVFPLYLLARKHLGSPPLAWIFCGVYLLNPLFNDINRYDFQPIAFAPLFVFAALYFYETGSSLGFLSSIILANSIQEFIALLTVFLAASLLALRIIESRRRNFQEITSRKVGSLLLLVTIVLGVAWFSFAYLAQSYFDPSTPLTSFLSVASSGPDPHGKALYLYLMVAPLLFTPLLEPILLAPVLPYVGVVLLGSHLAYWTIYYQYGAFTVPFIFYASVVALQKISWRLPKAFSFPGLKFLLAILVIANIAFSTNYSALSPLSPSAYTWSYVDSHDQTLASIIELVPLGASVLTQGQIYPHLINRASISLYRGSTALADRVTDVAPQYLMYDTTLSSFYYPPTLYGVTGNSSIPPFLSLPQIVSTGQYALYSAYDGIYLFQRDYQGPFVPPQGTVTKPLEPDQSWYYNVTYSLIPFGVSLTGGNYIGVVTDPAFYLNQSSFSLSFQLNESGKFLSHSWAGLIIGSKDSQNYSVINFNYLAGPMNFTSFVNGTPSSQLIGSTSPISSAVQYFHIVAHAGTLQVFLDSRLVGTAAVNPSLLEGGIGFENWMENTSIQFLQFTSLQ